MAGKNIEIIVENSGAMRIDAVGFKGSDCEKATAFLKKALGKVMRIRRKPEYYAGVGNSNRQSQGA